MGTHPIFESDFDCLTDGEGKCEKLFTCKLANAVTRLVLNFGRLLAKSTASLNVDSMKEINPFNWTEFRFITMKRVTTNMSHGPFWLILNLVQWTPFVEVVTANFFDQIILFLVNLVLATIGPKGIIQRAQSWSILFWMWSERRPNPATVSKDSNSHIH